MKWGSVAAVTVLSALLAACNGQSYSNPPGYATNCIPPTNAVLVYPKSGATGVADNTMAVYVAVPTALSSPSGLDVNIVGPPSYGSSLSQSFTTVAYGSIPTPNTVPSYSNPQYYEAVLNNPLTAATTFDVNWNNLNSACNSSTSASTVGSFTTQ
ncbi:MAG: hypothetical protein ACREMP_09115 [Candidatus Tyrphobacter sp.]